MIENPIKDLLSKPDTLIEWVAAWHAMDAQGAALVIGIRHRAPVAACIKLQRFKYKQRSPLKVYTDEELLGGFLIESFGKPAE